MSMYSIRRIAHKIQLILIACFVIGIIVYFMGTNGAFAINTAKMDNADEIESILSANKALAVMEYSYTNSFQMSDSSNYYGITVPYSSDGYAIYYEGTMKISVDLSGAVVEMDNKRVNVMLPRETVISHEIDEESIRIYDKGHKEFSHLQVSDMKRFKMAQESLAELQAEKDGIMNQAREQAVECVSSLISDGLPRGIELTIR